MRRPTLEMTRRPGGWLGMVLLLTPGAAGAGTFYVHVVPARVVSAEKVVGYVLEDPFARLSPPPSNPPAADSKPRELDSASRWQAVFEPRPARPPPVTELAHPKARVCRVRVNVPKGFWRTRKPASIYGSPALCDRVKAGEAIRLQVYGLVDLHRFVSIQLGEEWFSLPLMRETQDGTICSDVMAPPPEDDTDEEDLCKQMTHARAL